MKTKTIYCIFIGVFIHTSFNLSAQNATDRKNDRIVAEGKQLYRSEMASWHGTDLFLEKFPERRNEIGGYFSYSDSSVSKCIFFSKINKVIGTIAFDSTYSSETATIDGAERGFTSKEFELFTIRQSSL
jgi:hypothetical protein